MIDGINSGMLSSGHMAALETAKNQADFASFEQALKTAENAAEEKKKFTGLTGYRKTTFTEEEKAARLDKKLRDACVGFEAMYLELMWKEMRNTVPENTLFGESNAYKIWQSMLDSEMMQQTAKGGGVGLADMLYKQLKPQVAPSTDKNA